MTSPIADYLGKSANLRIYRPPTILQICSLLLLAEASPHELACRADAPPQKMRPQRCASWLTSGRWNPVPLSMLLTRMGYPPHFDGTPIRAMVDWLLSREAGLLMGVAASVFGCAGRLFEARSRLKPRSIGNCGLQFGRRNQ